MVFENSPKNHLTFIRIVRKPLWKSPPGSILGKVISGGGNMLVGYILLSKSNGSQTLAPQRDALLATGGPRPLALADTIKRYRYS
jgi:hypothetical protein